MAIQSGMRAIGVTFDVWGLSRLLDDALKKAWKLAEGYEGKQTTNGVSDAQNEPESEDKSV
jgi:hypothetical protein